jgi:hypothetical protein
MDNILQWYFIIGIITCLIGGIRAEKGMQSLPATELDSLCWLFFWWLYLPPFIFNVIKKLLKNAYRNKTFKE